MKAVIGKARLVTEHVPNMHSVLLGVAVPAGSSADPRDNAGMAHLCEHLHAVSCNSRLGPERLRRITLEAFTEREETYFLIRSLKEDAGILVKWLEYFLEPVRLAAGEFEREHTVVLEEVITLECSEIDKIDNAFMAAGYQGSRYSHPVAGISEELAIIGQDDSLNFIAANHYRSGLVVALVGDIDGTELAGDVISLLEKAVLGPGDALKARTRHNLAPGRHRVPSGLDMTYFVLGFPAMERSGADRGLLYATSAYLGDDIDSLLFRELRRERALLYSICTEYHLFRDAGHLLIKGVSSNENFSAVLQCLESIVDRMRSWSPTHETVAQLRHSLRKSLLLNLDDPRNKLLRILKHETWFSAFYSLEDDISFIEEIDGKGLSRLAASVFSQPSLLCYGA